MNQQKIDAIAAVRRNGLVLEFASDDLKNDKEVVLAAVRKNGLALQDASDDLKNDEYFLYDVDQIEKIVYGSDIYNCLNQDIQEKINENPDYLLSFEIVNRKPAKR